MIFLPEKNTGRKNPIPSSCIKKRLTGELFCF